MPIGFLFELGEGNFRGSGDRDEQVELALFRSDLRNVDVEVADGVVGEALGLGLVALHFGQATDAVAFEAAMQ